MRLGRRPKRKKDQALDVVASAARTWSEWQLAKRAGKGVVKTKKKASDLDPRKPSGVKRLVSGTTAKVVGGLAVVGGVGAALARKLKGGGHAEPIYTPPAPHEPAAMPPAPPPPPPPAPGAHAHEPPPPPPMPPLAVAPDPPAPETEPDPEPESEPLDEVPPPDETFAVMPSADAPEEAADEDPADSGDGDGDDGDDGDGDGGEKPKT